MSGQTESDARELRRLKGFMTRPGPRFGLAMALYADARQAASARRELRATAQLEGRRVAGLELGFDQGECDLVAAMVEAGEGADVLFVEGLELLVVDGSGRQRHTPAVANLNQRRDELPKQLDLRVVFWLPQVAYRELAEVAWDLCQVMLSTAEFTGVEAVEELTLEFDAGVEQQQPGWMRAAADGERETLAAQLEGLEQLVASRRDEERGELEHSAGEIAVRLGQLERGRELLRHAARSYSAAGERDDAASALHRAAEVSIVLGDFDEAERELERGRLELEPGEVALEAAVENAAEEQEGDELEDVASEEESERERAALRPPPSMPKELGMPAAAAAPRPPPAHPAAIPMSASSPARFAGPVSGGLAPPPEGPSPAPVRSRRHAPSQAARLGPALSVTAAKLSAAKGKREDSRSRLEDALAGYEAVGDDRGRAQVYDHLAALHEDMEEFDRALELRREHELPAHLAAEDDEGAAQARRKIAELLARAGQLQPAIDLIQQEVVPAVEQLDSPTAPQTQLQTYATLAAVLEAGGRANAAEQVRHEYRVSPSDSSPSLSASSTSHGQAEPSTEPAEQPLDHRRALALLVVVILVALAIVAGV